MQGCVAGCEATGGTTTYGSSATLAWSAMERQVLCMDSLDALCVVGPRSDALLLSCGAADALMPLLQGKIERVSWEVQVDERPSGAR